MNRRGFVLPLALFLLVVVAMMVALLLDGAVLELRTARGDFAGARAQAAAGSALSDLLATAPDSTALHLPAGAISASAADHGSDTTRVAVQSLGHGIVRITATARSWFGGMRGDAATLAFARITTDTTGPPGGLRYRRLPGWWWAQLP